MSEHELRPNPYVGLRPFFAEDSLYFFGREPQTAELLKILRAQRFLGVVGSSGSGKSSLVCAGLVPALVGGFLVDKRDSWHIIQMKPGGAPIFNLATGLTKAMEQTLDARRALDRAIRDDHDDAIVEFLKPRLKDNQNVFLLVDQFEEIFAFRGVDRDDGLESSDPDRLRQRASKRAEAADFVDLIMALAARKELPIYVVLTMRTDFLGDCDLFYGLPEALNRGRYLVPRLTREQLREAVECPALLKEAQIAPRLIDHLLNELGDRFDRLPVLQHALLRTWDVWKDSGRTGSIDLRHYQEAGGLERALDLDAESALKGLDEKATERVFKRLTKTDVNQRRVRDPARVSELVAASGADRGVIDEIIRHFEENGRNFVHTSGEDNPDDPRVDISHESLIRQWGRLRKWVDEERDSRDRCIELVGRAQKWEREEAGLLSGPELRGFVTWRAKGRPTPGWARRYFDAADALDCAGRYLDRSLEVQNEALAEVELQRRWTTPWSRLVGLAGIVGGILLVVFPLVNFLKELGEAVQKARDARAVIDDWFWAAILLSLMSLMVIAYLGVWVAVNRYAQRIYRRIVFPKILQEIVIAGDPNSPDGRTKAEFRDPAAVEKTTYAPLARRMIAFGIDFTLQAVFAFFVLLVVFLLIQIGISPDVPFEVYLFGYLGCVVLFNWWYAAVRVASKRQATLGMWIVGIYRTDMQGRRLSIGRASAWWLARLLLSTPPYGLGFLIQPFMRRAQTLHDWLAGSVVLLRPPATAASARVRQPTLAASASA